ncbi:MAG: alcohol dehydrogenase catalytic domain-containing protein [Gaiellales bacterium]
MRTRAVVLERTNGPLIVAELELAEPGEREVHVRIVASGVCHSDLNAIDGTAETPCPAVLGHEGAGVVEAVGAGVTRVRVGDHVALSWSPACGSCAECVRDLSWLCTDARDAMNDGLLPSRAIRLSRAGEPVFHYSCLSTFAEHAVVAETSCIPAPDGVPLEVAALVGCAVTTGVGAVWNTAHAQPGESVAVIGCGGVGLSAVMAAVAAGAEPVIAVDTDERKLAAAEALGARLRVGWQGGAEATAEAVRELTGGGVDHAIEATGRGEAMLAAVLATRPRGSAVLIGIPRADTVLPVPATLIQAGERRLVGSVYGSAKPERDFQTIFALYRAGRLPLERLISHRLPLGRIDEAFALMGSGEALRVILDPTLPEAVAA